MIDVIALARTVFGQAAILPCAELERFAQLIQQATAEECAETCEHVFGAPDGNEPEYDTHYQCAAAIRAKFAKEGTKDD